MELKNVFITRKIPDIGINTLINKGYSVDISPKDRPLKKKELIKYLKKKKYDAVLTLLTDIIDAEVMDACPTVKIYANYAIGFNNINIEEAKKRYIAVSNTPGGGADRVSEHTWALILALSCRVVEGDKYMKKRRFRGWDPLLLHGMKLVGKTLGIIGTGKIGSDVARKGKYGFGMNIIYYDIVRNENIEKSYPDGSNAIFYNNVEDVLKKADVVSIHVPLVDSTKHLINAERLRMMKNTAYLINTSRGPVVDENALVYALENNIIKGAGLDVFEFEPDMAKGLRDLDNVVLTPHIASGTEEARLDMARIAVENIIHTFEYGKALNPVYN